MWYLVILPLVSLSCALPQDSCQTATTQVVIPTTTATYTTTQVVTEYPSTAKDLGTFTLWKTLSSTKTLQTLTSHVPTCTSTDTVSYPFATETVYVNGTGGGAQAKHERDLYARDGCTVTVTATTTFGQTQVYVPANRTSTYWHYTAFTQATITSTTTGGKAYFIDTAHHNTPTHCADTTVTPTHMTATVTLDSRCSPSAMVSAYNGFGIDWLSDTPTGGATYVTNATDSSACCQLCAEAEDCATSAWDIRSGSCKLQFPVNPNSGNMNCGQGLLGYYNAGPNHPMSPGTGWFIAQICGNAQFGSARPDDGT